MKKLIALMLVLLLTLSLAACGSDAETTTEATEATEEATEVTEEVAEEATEETEEATEEAPEVDYSNDLPIVLDDGTILNPDGSVSDEETSEETATEPVDQNTATMAVLQGIWALYAEEEKFPIMGGNPEGGIMDAPGVWDLAYAEGLTAMMPFPAEQMANMTEVATMIHMMNGNTFSCAAVMLAEGTDAAAFAQAVRDAIQGNQWLCGMPEKLIVADLDNGCVLVSFGVNDAMSVFEGKLTTACAEAQILFNEAIAG